jgi:hypothetical protein
MMSIHAKVAAFIFLSLLLAGCVRPPPPMGRDLPANFNAANPAFDQRIKVDYPVGSSASTLRDELRKEGFTVITYDFTAGFQYSAQFSRSDLACKTLWTVFWSTDGDKITAIKGEYGATCL